MTTGKSWRIYITDAPTEPYVGVPRTSSNLRHLRLGESYMGLRCHALPISLTPRLHVCINIQSHILFLVLDYQQPNPLFHAPIGDSPKVHLSQVSLSLPALITQNSIFWILARERQLGNVSRLTLSQEKALISPQRRRGCLSTR